MIFLRLFNKLQNFRYREKQARQQKLSEEEKEIAAKEFFAKKVTYEWNQTVKQGPARKPFYINLKNVENGKDEYCFVVAGDLDNKTFTHVVSLFERLILIPFMSQLNPLRLSAN